MRSRIKPKGNISAINECSVICGPIGCAVDFVCRLLHLKIISLKKPLQIGLCNKAASHWKLDNLIAIIDVNNQQADGHSSEILAFEPIVDRWQSLVGTRSAWMATTWKLCLKHSIRHETMREHAQESLFVTPKWVKACRSWKAAKNTLYSC